MVLWVFGYASLVWKAGFDYDQRVVGFIKGYRRTFHLACIDHRGTPHYPARAANLEPEEGATCWGVAYCINLDEAARKALAYLEVRECEYDIKAHVAFFTEKSPDKPVISSVLVFLTTPDPVNNKYYLGPAPLTDMARQIATAAGPNGPNYEYIFYLEEALREIGHEDDEVIELASEVRKLLIGFNARGIILDGCTPRFSNGSTYQSHNTVASNLRLSPLNALNHGSLTGLSLVPVNSLGHMPCSPTLIKSRAM